MRHLFNHVASILSRDCIPLNLTPILQSNFQLSIEDNPLYFALWLFWEIRACRSTNFTLGNDGKLWYYVNGGGGERERGYGGYKKIVWFYQLSCYCKLAAVKSF